MYNTTEALYARNKRFSEDLEEFCPIFTSQERAIKYASKVANKFHPLKQTYRSTDNNENIVIYGDCWIMAVIPIWIDGKQYYEVVKAVNAEGDNATPYIDVRFYVLPIFENFQGIGLTAKEEKQLLRFSVNADGNVFKDGKVYTPQRSFDNPNDIYYHANVELDVHGVKEHRVSHIIWALFNGKSLDNVILLTSHIAHYCPHYISTTDEHQLKILALRNAGWQWCIEHIDSNPSNNALDNLQLCTLQAHNKLIDIRRNIYNFKTE